MEKYLGEKASAESIRRIPRKYNFHGRTAGNKSFVSKKIRIEIQDFAKAHLHKDFDYWKSVIYADESKYNIFTSDGKVWVWRLPNKELLQQNLRSTVKHSASVMVWGCMVASGVGNLEFIEGKMNYVDYINILKKHLKQSAIKMGLENRYLYYQDNDPKYKALDVRLWFLYNCSHVLATPPSHQTST